MREHRPPPRTNHVEEEFGAEVTLDVGALYERCTFRGSVLQGAELGDTRFVECEFRGANLSAAQVRGTAFQGPRFHGCKLTGIDWSTAAALSGAVFEECRLDSCAFVRMDLRGVQMVRCVAREAVFTEANLERAGLRGTDFLGARFGRTRLVEADLRDAVNYVVDPRENPMRGARVSLPDAVGILVALGLVLE